MQLCTIKCQLGPELKKGCGADGKVLLAWPGISHHEHGAGGGLAEQSAAGNWEFRFQQDLA